MKFVFYDTETTGTHVRFDQVLQFAAVYTDENFNELDRINLRCRLLPHIIPAPDALLVTRVDPNALMQEPLSHYEFARQIHARMSGWGPAVFIGHNTLKLDEEILRQTFWQNLLDPYVTSARGSIRADTLPILRAAHTIDPDTVKIATTENGNPSFKLDQIATMNGFNGHDAHDALGDVYATIYMARLVRERMPQVWNAMMAMADPRKAADLVEKNRMVRLLTYFGRPKIHDVTKVGQQPSNPKQIALFDLSRDPTPYLDLDADALLAAFDADERAFRLARTNAMPTLFPIDMPGLAATEPTERDVLVRRLDAIHGHPTFMQNVGLALEKRTERYGDSPHVEEQIYSGFPSWDDKSRMQAFHRLPDWAQRYAAIGQFQDRRLRSLALRLVYVNAPEVLPETVRNAVTRAMVRDRLLAEGDVPWTTLHAAKAALAGKPDSPEVANLRAWFEALEATLQAQLAATAEPESPAAA